MWILWIKVMQAGLSYTDSGSLRTNELAAFKWFAPVKNLLATPEE